MARSKAATALPMFRQGQDSYQMLANVDPGEKFSRATYEQAYLIACKLIVEYERRHPKEILAAANYLALHVAPKVLQGALSALERGQDIELIRLDMME